jgi:hypothetical protein
MAMKIMGMTYTPETEILDGVDVEVLAETGSVVSRTTLISSNLIIFGGWGKIVGILCGSVRML